MNQTITEQKDQLTQSLIDSLNPEAIVNITSTLNSLGVILNSFNTTESKKLLGEISGHSEELTQLIKKLVQMTKDGTLDSLIELATFIVAIKQSMNTEMVVKFIDIIPPVVKTTFTVEKMKDALISAKEEADKEHRKAGIGALLKILKDPDIQYLLNFMLIFAKKTAKVVKE